MSLRPLDLYRHAFSRMAPSGFAFPQQLHSGIVPFVYSQARRIPGHLSVSPSVSLEHNVCGFNRECPEVKSIDSACSP